MSLLAPRLVAGGGPRRSPQNPSSVLRAELAGAILGPRAFRVLAPVAQRSYTLVTRPSVAPRIEDIRNPDDRRLRHTLVMRAQIAREALGR